MADSSPLSPSRADGLFMSKRLDMLGMKIGRLTVVEFAGIQNSLVMWKCKCECGNEIIRSGSVLKRHRVNSCGCLQKDSTVARCWKHGKTRDKTWKCWQNILFRCNNPKCKGFHNYGGRGITVCERWNSFDNFLSDMGDCPEGLTIERKDTNGNYCPENCIWADCITQQNNRRDNFIINFNGQEYTAAELGRKFNMNGCLISQRIRKGWDINDAINTPVRHKSPNGSHCIYPSIPETVC